MNDLVKLVRELFNYDAETGVVTYRVANTRKKVGDKAGYIDSLGYITCRLPGGAEIRAHRLAWAHYYGEKPPPLIDHVNRQKTDNRISNLRSANRMINSFNSKVSKNNSSGFTGVSWHSQVGKWCARIKVGGKQKHLGLFETAEEASAAYNVAKARAVEG